MYDLVTRFDGKFIFCINNSYYTYNEVIPKDLSYITYFAIGNNMNVLHDWITHNNRIPYNYVIYESRIIPHYRILFYLR